MFISGAAGIQYIDCLEGISSLEQLWFSKLPNVCDFSTIGALENLSSLGVHGSGNFPNLDFLRSLKKLQRFSYTGTVENGDMTPCIGIEDIEFNYRSHYSHKLKEIQELTKSLKP
jgi:protein phosphatase 1 regulatory subunit 7